MLLFLFFVIIQSVWTNTSSKIWTFIIILINFLFSCEPFVNLVCKSEIETVNKKEILG